ncbi:MAG: magnesium/cobalt transporter CorA, partial [Ignavibacteriaceae bacterium]
MKFSSKSLTKKQTHKTGLPPGSLVFTGEQKLAHPNLSLIKYSETSCEVVDSLRAEDISSSIKKNGITWINIEGIHDTALVEKIGEVFHLHPLLLEDILNPQQRPKLDEYDDVVFIIAKMLFMDKKHDKIIDEQVSFVLGENFLLTFQESKPGDAFDLVRERIINNKGKIRKEKSDYLCYRLLDAIVDNYFEVLEKVGDRLEDIEMAIIQNPEKSSIQKTHELKRELIYLRKITWPLREVINNFHRGEHALINQTTKIYMRDLYDHTIQVIDTIETYRDWLSGLEDLYLSSLSNKMNEVMKILTMIATLFIPLTFIVGLYGMNFKFMPELEWKWGYPFVWGIMITLTVFMTFYFKKKKWF